MVLVLSAAGCLAFLRRRRAEEPREIATTFDPSASAPPIAAIVSYARPDSTVAREIARSLNRRGIGTFIDTGSIQPGERWRQSIVTAIEDCKVMLVLVSPASNVSREVAREVAIAQDRKKTVIPLLLEGQVPKGELTYPLAEVQGIRVSSENYQSSLNLILHALARNEIPTEDEGT